MSEQENSATGNREFVRPESLDNPSEELVVQLGRAESDLKYTLAVIEHNTVKGHHGAGQAAEYVGKAWTAYHRRLHVVTCWPDLIFWESDEPSERQWRWGKPPFTDGAILGYLIDDPQNPEPPPSRQAG